MNKRFKKSDFILIAGIIITIILAFTSYHFLYKQEGDLISIHVDGNLYQTLPLDTDIHMTIPNSLGTNVLVIEDGFASIEEADCPDKLCVEQKKIHYLGETLVCLPHKVVVTVISGDESKLDGVAS